MIRTDNLRARVAEIKSIRGEKIILPSSRCELTIDKYNNELKTVWMGSTNWVLYHLRYPIFFVPQFVFTGQKETPRTHDVSKIRVGQTHWLFTVETDLEYAGLYAITGVAGCRQFNVTEIDVLPDIPYPVLSYVLGHLETSLDQKTRMASSDRLAERRDAQTQRLLENQRAQIKARRLANGDIITGAHAEEAARVDE